MNPVILFFIALEILAFVLGIRYYRNNKSRYSFYLVLFLGITVFVELLASYANYTSEDELFGFLKETNFEKNFWLYNIYHVISAVFYISYFKWHINSIKIKKFLNIIIALFTVLAIAYLIFSGNFFRQFSPITVIIGTILIHLSISIYFLELLKSDKILQIQRSLPFYVAIAAFLFHLCTTPLFIYSTYFSENLNPEFVTLYKAVVLSANFIMYSLYIAGFIICNRQKTSS